MRSIPRADRDRTGARRAQRRLSDRQPDFGPCVNVLSSVCSDATPPRDGGIVRDGGVKIAARHLSQSCPPDEQSEGSPLTLTRDERIDRKIAFSGEVDFRFAAENASNATRPDVTTDRER